MKKRLSLFFLFLILMTGAQSQVQNGTFNINPATFGVNDEITITVSGVDPSVWGTTDIYLWAWYFDGNGDFGGDSPTNGTWENSNEAQRFTANGDGTYSYTLTPASFYGTTNISRMGMLAKAKDGTGDKKTQDNLVDVGGFQLVLTNPTATTTLVNQGEDFGISAETSLSATFELRANGNLVDTQSSITNYNYVYSVDETTQFELIASQNGESLSQNFTLVVQPTVNEAALPPGLKDGINLDPGDPTRATLVLFAPGKSFVHVIGDFNNWSIDDDYLMNLDSSKNRFWIELSGLTPQFDHLFQYLVDLDINVADPYSTLILDGFGNDSFIDETIFPNLPAYPSGQSKAITVLRTGDSEYSWQVNDFQKPKKEDLVIYELLVRDFDERHSFDALRDRLDYLENLGINAIELMPINEFDGNESWGYNPSFHMALDKYYGTKNALKQLIDECHSRGIAVIVDVVYNHGSGQHPFYQLWNTDNGGTGGQASGDNPFFNPSATHSYSVFNDFNHQQQATRDYVKQTVRYWIEEFRIDGMRWDLTKGFTQNCSSSDEGCTNATQNDRIEVLKEYADVQWEEDENFLVIFEHLGGIQEEEQWANYRIGEGKGILMWNKQTGPYNEATMGYHTSNGSNFSGASYLVKGFSQPSAVSYMESHDEERLMFKNLEFGNAEGNYNVKNLNTALDRMQTAGAFFFSIPGPKMIWQFGELGYDISIDQNGRTGNKPILWEYVDDPNRFAIYQSWSDLIKLKIEEPIFESQDFSLNLGGSTGFKAIYLSDPSANGDQISEVVIIGNFGTSSLEANPNFPSTGTWYNLLKNNQPITVNTTNQPVTLEPGEFFLFADQPSLVLLDPNDLDGDGVPNESDLCPDTPFGSAVDVDGCEVFTLPANNFRVQTQGESCASSDDGLVLLEVLNTQNYTIDLSSGGNLISTDSFSSSSWTSTELAAGQYTLCIGVEGVANYQQCFDLLIEEPEPLSVSSKVDQNAEKIALNLSGSDLYTISLNGVRNQTSDQNVVLDLEQGMNYLEVRGKKDCQGVFKQQIYIGDTLKISPNPASDNVLLYYPAEVGSIGFGKSIELYTLSGQLVKKYEVSENSPTQELRLNDIPSGLYLLKWGSFSVRLLKR